MKKQKKKKQRKELDNKRWNEKHKMNKKLNDGKGEETEEAKHEEGGD